MNNQVLVEFLWKNHACRESLKWLEDRDLTKTWAECERGDWLLWLAAKAGIDYAAYADAAAEAAYAAKVTTQRKTADIVRAMITVEEIEAAILAQGMERTQEKHGGTRAIQYGPGMVELASVEART